MPDRLTPTDAAFLALEDADTPMQLYGLLLCDGPAMDLREFRAAVAARLPLIPRFRQRLAFPPLGIARPTWVPDADFHLDRHVGARTLRAPGDRAALKELCDLEAARPMDKAHPLWRMDLVDGFEDGGMGIAMTLHHCMVDGLSIMHVLATLFAPAPDDVGAAGPGAPPAPGALAAIAHAAADSRARATGALSAAPRLLARPRRTLGTAVRRGRGLATLASSVGRAPDGPLNQGRPSPRRDTAWIPVPLDRMKAAKASYGETVNTVLLAGIGAGLSAYLKRRGGHDGGHVNVFVPVNVRGGLDAPGLGNRISMTYPALPTGPMDPAARVRAVAEETRRIGRGDQAAGSADAIALTEALPPLIADPLSRVAYLDGRLFNLTVTNVPGPGRPVAFEGRRLRELMGVAPLTRRHPVTIAALSYDGTMFLSITVDPERVPDGDVLARDIDRGVQSVLRVG